jgi:hypothetical protein
LITEAKKKQNNVKKNDIKLQQIAINLKYGSCESSNHQREDVCVDCRGQIRMVGMAKIPTKISWGHSSSLYLMHLGDMIACLFKIQSIYLCTVEAPPTHKIL